VNDNYGKNNASKTRVIYIVIFDQFSFNCAITLFKTYKQSA